MQIEVKVYKQPTKSGGDRLIAFDPKYRKIDLAEFLEMIRDGDFKMNGDDFARYAVSAMARVEPVEPKDKALANRIIRGGGLIEYIRKTEGLR
jgi:hypothetical protein